MPSDDAESTVAVEQVTSGLVLWQADQPRRALMDGPEWDYAVVLEERPTAKYAWVTLYAKNCIRGNSTSSREAADRLIRSLLDGEPRHLRDTPPRPDNTVLFLHKPFKGDFTQREFFGEKTLADYGVTPDAQ